MLQAAAGAAGLDVNELWHALGDSGRMDLADGGLPLAALECFAMSISARWRRGFILPGDRWTPGDPATPPVPATPPPIGRRGR
jgi:hypothetical protein